MRSCLDFHAGEHLPKPRWFKIISYSQIFLALSAVFLSLGAYLLGYGHFSRGSSFLFPPPNGTRPAVNFSVQRVFEASGFGKSSEPIGTGDVHPGANSSAEYLGSVKAASHGSQAIVEQLGTLQNSTVSLDNSHEQPSQWGAQLNSTEKLTNSPPDHKLPSQANNSSSAPFSIEPEKPKAPQAESKQASMLSDSTSFPTFSFDEKYLFYARGGDFCKGARHTIWSLSCGLGEALYLNRTFVLDMVYCVPSEHNNGKETKKDARLYFDIPQIQRYVRVIPRASFLKAWAENDAKHAGNRVTVKRVLWNAASPPLRSESATIIQRNLAGKGAYAYRVCDGVQANHVIQRPWQAVWGCAPQLMDMAWAICADLKWDFDSVHVRRGDKAEDSQKWPNLDRDTKPPRLTETLGKRIKRGRRVYIATNEPASHLFSPLRELFHVRQLWDYSHLWANGSRWWNASKAILGPESKEEPEFDGVMRGLVDYVVFHQAKLQLETFNDLTKDPKHGIPSP